MQKTDEETEEEKGILMIQYLQKLNGIDESEEDAREGWQDMSAFERSTTHAAYKACGGDVLDVMRSEKNPNNITTAIWCNEIDVIDPDTGNAIAVAVYKHENGVMFAVASSFVEQIAYEDTDNDLVVCVGDPFDVGKKVRLLEP